MPCLKCCVIIHPPTPLSTHTTVDGAADLITEKAQKLMDITIHKAKVKFSKIREHVQAELKEKIKDVQAMASGVVKQIEDAIKAR